MAAFRLAPVPHYVSHILKWSAIRIHQNPTGTTCMKALAGSELVRSSAGMKERGKLEIPEKNPPASGITWHDSHMRRSGVALPGIEPGSPSWEASRLTAQPPRPPPLPFFFASSRNFTNDSRRRSFISHIECVSVCVIANKRFRKIFPSRKQSLGGGSWESPARLFLLESAVHRYWLLDENDELGLVHIYADRAKQTEQTEVVVVRVNVLKEGQDSSLRDSPDLTVHVDVPTIPSSRDRLFVCIGGGGGGTVAQRLARSPPTIRRTVFNPRPGHRIFVSGNRARAIPLDGGFTRGSPVSPALSFWRRSILTSITLIGSQDDAASSKYNLDIALSRGVFFFREAVPAGGGSPFGPADTRRRGWITNMPSARAPQASSLSPWTTNWIILDKEGGLGGLERATVPGDTCEERG
ncbi:hypothetical protein PR048_021170 [Dryococelus australis]|uniref:Uncharacterized protein n=1 Tax=Dryococelus australis TaxID=614101 RepID=A0ABQ9GXH0_9NEOP|nr:hypothetical protein PR048_021170 [Dryococelus australis]